MRLLSTLGLVSLALLMSPHLARAQPQALSVVEHALGASPLHSVAGHGGLTAGVTREGDIAVLAWPGPSCCDQLTHLAPNDLDARSRPRTGVREGFGVALGVVLRTASSTEVHWLHDATRWRIAPGYVDDVSLEPRTTYQHTSLGVRVVVLDAVLPDRDVLQRRVTLTRETGSPVTGAALMVHANLGLTLDAVPRLPFGDVVGDRRNDFGVAWDSTRRAALHFRPADRGAARDILALVNPEPLAADHFGPLDALMRMNGDVGAESASLVRDLDRTYGRGVYALVATDTPADQYHMGREGSALCEELTRLIENVGVLGRTGLPLPISPSVAGNFRCPEAVLPASVATARGWTRVIPSAWDDARDGELSGNPVAAYLNDSAQRAPVTFDASGNGEVRVFIAFGATAAEAGDALTAGRALTADAFVARDHEAWITRASSLRLPTALPLPEADRDRVVRASRRALLHVYNGTDRATGAIVASIARQAPYGLDWPRDGAFFDYALDVAGDSAAVTRRLAWVLPLARRNPVTPSQLFLLTDPRPPIDPRTGGMQYPEAAWEMNYYSTGDMGGFIRFEIDNTALMVWSAAVHVAYVPESERMALATRHWDQVRASADLLADWRDATTGLHARANEDDNTAFTATLHGAVTVFAGLEGAARLARFLGHTQEAARWERRASELRDASVRAFYDPNLGRFINTAEGAAQTNPGSSPLGATAWMVWPARMFGYDDPRFERQMRADMDHILAQLRGDPGTDGGAYLTKTTLSAAMYAATRTDSPVRGQVLEALTRIARDVLTPDTQVMGEVFITRRNGDGGAVTYENRVSIPHLWEATLFYLSAMALSDASRFDLDRRLLPMNQTPPPGTVPLPVLMDGGTPDASTTPRPQEPSGDCGCHTNGASTRTPWLTWVALAILARLSRRRRRAHGL
jgi:MYXO-CTERM domain-containing protein